MKYVVLKNALTVLCVQLPEGFGTQLEIVCFENQIEFDDFIKTKEPNFCQVYLPQTQPRPIRGIDTILSQYDGIFIKKNEYLKKVAFSDIMWVEASRSYCYLNLIDNTRIIVTYPMGEIRKKLPQEMFIQPHRSYLVNKQLINKFIGNMLYIDNHSFPISRKFKKEVLEQFFFLDNIKDAFGKDTIPEGKENLPSGKNIRTNKGNNVTSDGEGV